MTCVMNLVNKLEQDGQKCLKNKKTESNEMKQLNTFLADPSINPNFQGKFGFTALIRAVQEENKAVVESILACHRVDANLEDDNGYTPLIWAADQGSVWSVRLLLRGRDIKVNMVDTPLSVGIRHGPLKDNQEPVAG